MVTAERLHCVLSRAEGNQGALNGSTQGVEQNAVTLAFEFYFLLAFEGTLEAAIYFVEGQVGADQEGGLASLSWVRRVGDGRARTHTWTHPI